MRRRAHLLINGRVQGVGFRAAVARCAEGNGISGWVRNLQDGRVEAMAEGESAEMAAFIDFCRSGPTGARVDHCLVTEGPAAGDHSGFEVRRP